LIGNKIMKNLDIKKRKKRKYSEGIAIYMAVTITAALILVSFAVVNLVLKQIGISGAARDSQAAFYAADSGIECALYWDLKNPTDTTRSAFSTATPTQTSIKCQGSNIPISVSSNSTTTFSFTLSPEPYCVNVGVSKKFVGNTLTTQIEARGYNTCAVGNSRRVERAIYVSY